MDIEANLQTYLSERQVAARYASFDYCFNYFRSFQEQGKLESLGSDEHLQMSCLQLAFYLASWGMLRGSSFLLGKSIRFYESVILAISQMPPVLWEVDVDSYTSAHITLLLDCARKLREVLGEKNHPSDILVTKIMLGIFGSVPAFDTNFQHGFGINTFSRKSLEKIAAFYNANQAIIEKYRIPTVDFLSGRDTHWLYTRAKVIDMIFFIEGSNKRN